MSRLRLQPQLDLPRIALILNQRLDLRALNVLSELGGELDHLIPRHRRTIIDDRTQLLRRAANLGRELLRDGLSGNLNLGTIGLHPEHRLDLARARA